MLRTSGTRTTAVLAATIVTAASTNVVSMPIHSASGPQSANPSGIKTSDTAQSYELTRESVSFGTADWSTVSQSVFATMIEISATRESAASAAVGSGIAKAAT